jgi:hypothetical protein
MPSSTHSSQESHVLCPPETEILRERVLAAVQSHLPDVRPPGRSPCATSAQVDETARAALDAMLTRPFRVGTLPAADVYNQLMWRVRRCVARGEPIRISMGYGAQKNPHAMYGSRADWSEFFALGHLIAWHNKVQAIYPPGLRIRIVVDDATLLWANHGDARRMASYSASLGALIRAMRFERVLLTPVRLSWFSWICRPLYPLARWRVLRWERDPANHDQVERMAGAARRNLDLPPGLAPDEEDRTVREAARRYRVFWEAMRLSHLSQGTRNIIAMYLDGSQHHIQQQVAMHLTTLDKGQVTQPWQGEGALRDNGHGRLEPYVLTAHRRQQSVIETVEGLDVVPYPGFDRIAVVLSDEQRAVELPDHAARIVPDLAHQLAGRP